MSPAKAPRRVNVYIDGFNLYHAMAEGAPKHYRWLDLWALGQSMLRDNEELVAVKYFTAYATWLPGPYARHRDYVQALTTRGVTTVLGRFKEKSRGCKACGSTWIGHEEKESDVNIALHLVTDALAGAMDRAILVTADSDLCPAIAMTKSLAPRVEVFVATPPDMFGRARDLNPRMTITKGRIGKCQLPDEVTDSSGAVIIRRPTSYAVPGS